MDKRIDPPNPRKYTLFSIAHQKGISRDPGFHTHVHYEVFIFHQGKCTYLIDNKIYELLPGDMIVMDGSKLHKPSVLGDKNLYDRSIVQFSPEWIEPLLNFLQSDYLLDPFKKNHYTIYRTNNGEPTEDLINLVVKIEDLLKLPVSLEKENELKVVVVELLLSIHKLHKYIITDAAIILDEKNIYIQQIATYIQNHYNKKIQLEDIEKEVNISKSYLVHLFKEQTGYTIMEYLMQYRLTQVLHLMKMYPNVSIKDLSNQCGFESEAHFSRFFKKNLGQSPSVFRKKLSEGEGIS
ncbi:AraC family transcriptional regulator [Niallia endozanthoxylica]|uniref:AraC family transcriptional regulator n=1 Tax=Niallia endozanthoxylica TaxID=2036016 RepID=A0A5J5HUC8_9BACI|nr:AraC family transcriptional regulator [Niallia endozanthoxylica]KAA9023905.1 AraC family transcriptional regulator [Niallia endozanthoxylica]